MVSAVIFDFDGVIIDSRELQKKALFESYRITVGDGEPSFEEFLSYSGDSINNILKKMGLPQAMVEPYINILHSNAASVSVFDGMDNILLKLKKLGIKIGLCTGKDRIGTEKTLEYINFNKYFDTVICADDVGNPKPHPDSLFSAVNSLDVDKEKTIMVGDGKNDIRCAKNAGIRSIAVTWGDCDRYILNNENPDFIVNNPDELLSCILEIVS